MPLEATALETLLLALALTAHLHHPREQTAAAQATTPAQRRTQPAHLDGLTEIPNRTALDEHLTAAWERARRTNTPLAALLLDIDHFHTYNDTYGHLAGDDVLRRIAATLTATASRNDDVAGRYDGDKFLALLPATDLAGARHIADALRTAVNALDLANGAVPSKRAYRQHRRRVGHPASRRGLHRRAARGRHRHGGRRGGAAAPGRHRAPRRQDDGPQPRGRGRTDRTPDRVPLA